MEVIDTNDIYFEMFANVHELYDVCGKRRARGFKAGDQLSESYLEDRSDWAGFRDGEQLKKDAIGGQISAGVIQPITAKLRNLHATKGARISVMHEEMGFQPDIDAVLNGEQRYMLSVRETPQARRVLRLFVNLGAHCGISANEMNSAGTALIETIAGMELSGQYRLEIFAGDSFGGSKLYGMGIRVKSASQPMNVTRMAWPMVNASAFTRGLSFGWYNRTPSKVRELSGYGRPWSGTNYDLRQSLKKELQKRGMTILSISDIIRWVRTGKDIETAILNEVKEANTI